MPLRAPFPLSLLLHCFPLTGGARRGVQSCSERAVIHRGRDALALCDSAPCFSHSEILPVSPEELLPQFAIVNEVILCSIRWSPSLWAAHNELWMGIPVSHVSLIASKRSSYSQLKQWLHIGTTIMTPSIPFSGKKFSLLSSVSKCFGKVFSAKSE